MRIMPEGFAQEPLEHVADPWRPLEKPLEPILAVESAHQRRLEPVEQQTGAFRQGETLGELLAEVLQRRLGGGQGRCFNAVGRFL